MRIMHPSPRSFISSALRHFCSSTTKRFQSFRSLRSPILRTLAFTTPIPSPLKSMADTQNLSTPISAEDDSKFGFTRPEMYSTKLAGTVSQYDRHMFLCFKTPEAWLPHVEDSETDLLPKLLSAALKARKNDIALKTNLTICEGREGTEFESGDVLIFPDMIKYKGLKDSDVDGFVDDVLVHGKPWASGIQEVLSGSYVFVCSHGSRDKRCGVCGPVLIEKLKEGTESRGLTDVVFISACSHVGGHKYAGNVIIFSPDSEGKIMGHWYGYVTPDDLPEILDQHIGKGGVIQRIWRGQLGASAEGGEQVAEQKLPNGKDVKEGKKHQESNIEAVKENAGGCCQGASGFSCCRDGNSGASEEKKLKESTEANGKTGLGGKISSLMASLDRSDVFAAVAVVGAFATIAVAYSLYRRSG